MLIRSNQMVGCPANTSLTIFMSLVMICHGLLATNHAQQSKDLQEARPYNYGLVQLPCEKQLLKISDDLVQKKMALQEQQTTNANLKKEISSLSNADPNSGSNLIPLRKQITDASADRTKWKQKADDIKKVNIHQKEVLQTMLSKFQTNTLAAYDDSGKKMSKTLEGVLNELKAMAASTTPDPVENVLNGLQIPQENNVDSPTEDELTTAAQPTTKAQAMVPKTVQDEAQPETLDPALDQPATQDLSSTAEQPATEAQAMVPKMAQDEAQPETLDPTLDQPSTAEQPVTEALATVPEPVQDEAQPKMLDEQLELPDAMPTEEEQMMEENAPLDVN